MGNDLNIILGAMLDTTKKSKDALNAQIELLQKDLKHLKLQVDFESDVFKQLQSAIAKLGNVKINVDGNTKGFIKDLDLLQSEIDKVTNKARQIGKTKTTILADGSVQEVKKYKDEAEKLYTITKKLSDNKLIGGKVQLESISAGEYINNFKMLEKTLDRELNKISEKSRKLKLNLGTEVDDETIKNFTDLQKILTEFADSKNGIYTQKDLDKQVEGVYKNLDEYEKKLSVNLKERVSEQEKLNKAQKEEETRKKRISENLQFTSTLESDATKTKSNVHDSSKNGIRTVVDQYKNGETEVYKVVTKINSENGEILDCIIQQNLNYEKQAKIKEKQLALDKKQEEDLINQMADGRINSEKKRAEEERKSNKKQAEFINKNLEQTHENELKFINEVEDARIKSTQRVKEEEKKADKLQNDAINNAKEQKFIETQKLLDRIESYNLKNEVKLGNFQQDNKGFYDEKQFNSILKKQEQIVKEFKDGNIELREAEKQLEKNDTEMSKLINNSKRVKKEFEEMSTVAGKFGSAVGRYFTQMAVWQGVGTAQYAMYDMLRTVTELDTAMIDLQKVSSATFEEYKKFEEQSFVIADKLGTRAKDVIDSTTEFARMGYSLEESSRIAENIQVYTMVEDIDAVEASQQLISTMKGFNLTAEDSINIIDQMNEVSNNYSITASGIGEALKRSSNAMHEANNTLSESISLITVANQTSQNPELVGNAMKTISMRLRGVNEETGELIPKMRELILMQTDNKVDIMIDEENFKSTYDIILELSKVWKDLTDVQKSYLSDTLAGKHRGSVFMGLMNSAEDLEGVLETAINSSGSAMDEHAERMKSVVANIQQLSNAWDELAFNTISSEFMITVLDLATSMVKLIDDIGLVNIAFVALIGTLSFFSAKNKFVVNYMRSIGQESLLTSKQIVKADGATKMWAKSLLGLGKSLGWMALFQGGLMIFDHFTTSTQESAETMATLTGECESLTSQINELNNQPYRSADDLAKIENLEKQLEVKKELLEISKQENIENQLHGNKLNPFDGLSGEIKKLNSQYINQIDGTDLKEILPLKEFQQAQAELDRLNKKYQELQGSGSATAQELSKVTNQIVKQEGAVKLAETELKKARLEYEEMIPKLEEFISTTNDSKSKEFAQGLLETAKAFLQNTNVIEDTSDSLVNYNAKIRENEAVMQQLQGIINGVNTGYIYSKEQIDKLCATYPFLVNHIKATADGYIIEKSALSELESTSSTAHYNMVDWQIKNTQATIDEINKRIDGYRAEAKALAELASAKNAKIDANGYYELEYFNANPNQIDKYIQNNADSIAKAEKEKANALNALARLENIKATGKSGGNPIGSPSGNKSNSGGNKSGSGSSKTNYGKYFNLGLDDIIKDIEASEDEIIKKINETQANIDKAITIGDQKSELSLQKNLTEYYSEQAKINQEMVKKLQNEQLYWANTLAKNNYSTLNGIDLVSITEKQLSDIMREYEKMIANAEGNDKRKAELEKERDKIEEFANAIIDANELIADKTVSALELENKALEENIKLIERKSDLLKRQYDNELVDLEQSQILMDSDSSEYFQVENKKYELVLKQQERIYNQIQDYRRQGLLDTSDEIMSLKEQWEDYETDRLTMIADSKKKEKELKESLEKEIQNALLDALKDGVDKRKKELDKELKQYNKAIDDVMKKMDREDSTKDYEEQEKEQSEKIISIQEDINKYKLASASGDADAKLKVAELEKQLAEEQKKLEKMQYDREKELRKDNLNDMKDKAEEETKKAKEELDNQYEDKKQQIENMTGLVDMSHAEWTAIIENFYGDIGVSADGYKKKLQELQEETKKVANMSNNLGLTVSGNKGDSDKYDPDNENNERPLTEQQAKELEQQKQADYLHQKALEAQQTGNTGLAKWVEEERKLWGLDKWGGITEKGKIPDSHWNNVKKKYGFYRGGQTSGTGWHWLDGEPNKPERILSPEQTKAFNKLVDYAPMLTKYMENLFDNISVNSGTTVELKVENLVNIEGDVSDNKTVSKITNATNEVLTNIGNALSRKGLRFS